MVFDSHFRRVLAAALVAAFAAAAGGAFSAGLLGALVHNAGDPRSAPTVRLASLKTLDDSLGAGGFLGIYSGGDGAALQRLTSQADAAIEGFRAGSLSETDRDRAANLRDAVEPFRKAARVAASGAAPGAAEVLELRRAYADLKIRADGAETSARRAQTEELAAAFSIAAFLLFLALLALAATLSIAAWYIRTRINRPVEMLRSSINGAASGMMDEPVWGLSRRDEIGGIARAAERLRQAAVLAHKVAPSEAKAMSSEPLSRVAPRLATAETLELTQDLARVADTAMEAQARIEAAGMRAAKASQMALDAAAFARETSTRFAQRAETALELASAQSNAVLGALAAAVERLSHTAQQIERTPSLTSGESEGGKNSAKILTAPDRFAANGRDSVIDDLLSDLEALERFAREQRNDGGEKAARIAATLGEAIGRLNAVSDRLSSSAGEGRIRVAG